MDKCPSEVIVAITISVVAFIVGHAWGELIDELLETYLPNAKDSLIVRGIYTLILTVVLLLLVIWGINKFKNYN